MNPAINEGEDFVFDKRAPGFVTYRGLSLSQTEVDKFQALVPSKLCYPCKNLGCYKFNRERLNGYTSTTRNLEVALDFAKD